MTINFSNFFKAEYLFDPRPSGNSRFILILLVLFILVIIVTCILRSIFNRMAQETKPYKNLLENFFFPMLTCAILGIVLIFFRWQELPYLASRVLTIGLIGFMLIWFLSVAVYSQTAFKKELKEFREKQVFEKYIPKPKNIKRRK